MARRSHSDVLCRWACVAAVLLPLACGASSPKQPGSPATGVTRDADGTVDVFVQKIELQHLLADRAELSADIEILPHMDGVLHAVRFRGLRLDGATPVYMDPLEGNYKLQAGHALLLPHTRFDVYYSDFPTPAAMDDMLAAHHAQVTGEVRAGLQLSLAAKLLIHDLHPVVVLRLQQDVPFDEAAVDAPTQLGIGILAVAQRAVGASASVLERVAGVRVQVEVDPVSEAERNAIVLVRTTYHIKGAVAERSCDRLGFWVDSEHVLVPAEVLEPWAYSVEAAEAIAANSASVDPLSVRTVVGPAPSASGRLSTWRATQGDFDIEQRGHPQAVRLLTSLGQPISVLERGSAGNYAVLHIKSNHGYPAAAPGTERAEVSALRRPTRAGQPLRRLPLGAESLQAGSALPRPVDESVFGSPLTVDGVVIGMVTGETTWVPLTSIAADSMKTSEITRPQTRSGLQPAPP